MSKPTVAIVGRPNVGKSTLLNRVIGRREAIVEEKPGVTRDRKLVDAEWNGREFTLVDTGGWLETEHALDKQVSQQAERAIKAADVVLVVVDVTVGVTDEDERVARLLRRSGKSVLLVVNKVDSERREPDAWEFARLGLGDPYAISSLHGRGTGDLLDDVVKLLPQDEAEPVDEDEAEEADRVPAVAIVGRPNVGKSTLFNRLIGDDRSVVHDLPGTTRDAIDTVIETEEGPIRFVDTAGMRRKSRIDEGT
ncbi:MAG TPA: ribosome biogenesis GTPase Der, partial [Acidimicrobiales bacterium]|nr:ribosome biogenesis GTPase Der [Acidimicrobiales bacterium]